MLKNADGEPIGICSLLYHQPEANMGKLLGPPAQQPVPDLPHMLQSMLSHAPVGIGKLDLAGRILWATPAIEKMLGYPLDELLHRTISDINHPED